MTRKEAESLRRKIRRIDPSAKTKRGGYTGRAMWKPAAVAVVSKNKPGGEVGAKLLALGLSYDAFGMDVIYYTRESRTL